jgi:hypothetical protein
MGDFNSLVTPGSSSESNFFINNNNNNNNCDHISESISPASNLLSRITRADIDTDENPYDK